LKRTAGEITLGLGLDLASEMAVIESGQSKAKDHVTCPNFPFLAILSKLDEELEVKGTKSKTKRKKWKCPTFIHAGATGIESPRCRTSKPSRAEPQALTPDAYHLYTFAHHHFHQQF
jgi:hypothetical protein